jgi:hypothetical protein
MAKQTTAGGGFRYRPSGVQTAARQARYVARQTYLAGRRTRREDTRRKILVGAVVLGLAEQGVVDPDVLRQWLDAALVRSDDRALFGLAIVR